MILGKRGHMPLASLISLILSELPSKDNDGIKCDTVMNFLLPASSKVLATW